MKLGLPLFLGLLPVAFAQQYTISTIAGTGRIAFGGAGAAAVNARLIQPYGVAADGAGNIFISDQYYLQVFRIDLNGVISVYAGVGAPGSAGDMGKATAARFGLPGLLATDAAGNLYIADAVNGNVRRVSPDGIITTSATLGGTGVATDSKGNLYVAGGNTIHIVHTDGTATLIAGTGKPGYSGDNSQAVNAQLFTPQGMKVDASGNLFVADFGNNVIRKITPQGVITTFAGNGKAGAGGNGVAATSSPMNGPQDLALDSSGGVYVAEAGQIRQIDKNGIITLIAGGGLSTDDGPAKQAYLIYPFGLALDSKGNLLVALGDNKQVRRVTPLGTIMTVAGLPPTSSLGENVPAVSTPLLSPKGIVADPAGNVYISDWADERIRKVSIAGIINTEAGNGLWGHTGDNGPALAADLGSPYYLGLDSGGNLYVSDHGGSAHTVRRIAPNGTIATVAGGAPGGLGLGVSGASIGDGGKATDATLDFPRGIAADAAGNLYIADQDHDRIRRVDTSGTITTFAGTGVAGYSGDNGPAAAAQLFFPEQLAIDKMGNLYVADSGNNCIRKITPAGIITTFAGTGVAGAGGDGGPAVNALLTAPTGVALDAAGNVYIAGPGARIRKVGASTGTISTIAGTGTAGFSGDGGSATSAQINLPDNITVDSSSNVYFTEAGNLRVRKLTPQWITAAGVLNGASLLAGSVSPGEIVALNVTGFDPTQTGAQVIFDGTPATVISTQPTQITAVVPYEVGGQNSTQLQIVAGAITTNTVPIPVANTAPGIFTQDSSGMGPGLIANADSTPNSPANPAARESMVTITATGEGQTNPPGVDGQITPAAPPMPLQAVSVQIGGVDAPVTSAGGAPNQPAGYFQVVAQVPDGAPTGDAVPIVLMVGGVASQAGVTISVQ